MTEILAPESPRAARKVSQCANIEILVNKSLVRSIMYFNEENVQLKRKEGLRDINI